MKNVYGTYATRGPNYRGHGSVRVRDRITVEIRVRVALSFGFE